MLVIVELYRRCGVYYDDKDALRDHLEKSSMHNICWECNVDFTQRWGLVQHYVQSPHHHYCQQCNKHFSSPEELLSHYRAHHYYCDICNKTLRCSIGLHEHRRQKHPDCYCVPCKRMFERASELDSHHRSNEPHGRTVLCPMPRCRELFFSAADLLDHLKSGACVVPMDRAMINRIMVHVGHDHVIANSQ